MASLYSVQTFRGHCDTALLCADLAEGLRDAIEAGEDATAYVHRLADQTERLHAPLFGMGPESEVRLERDSFLRRYPGLASPVEAFESAVKDFYEAMRRRRSRTWPEAAADAAAALRKAAGTLDAALDAPSTPPVPEWILTNKAELLENLYPDRQLSGGYTPLLDKLRDAGDIEMRPPARRRGRRTLEVKFGDPDQHAAVWRRIVASRPN